MLTAKLTQKMGPEPGKIYFLSTTGINSIGRLVSNTIHLPGKGVSRQHCLIETRDGVFIISDLGSTNETQVNGRSISEYKLNEGDEITVGEYLLSFGLSAGEDKKNIPAPGMNPLYTEEEADTVVGHAISEENALYTAPLQIKVNNDNYERVCRDLSILCDVSKVINSENNLARTLEKLLDLVLQAAQSQRCAIYLMTDKDRELKQAAARVINDNDASPRIPLSRTIAERVLKQGESLLCSNIATDSRFKKAQSMIILGHRSVICVPLKSGKKIIGLLYADTMAKDACFSKDDLELLTAIGNQAGVAINNILLYKNLDEQKQLNADIVENIDEGILVVNAQGLIIFANSRLEELTGYRLQKDTLQGKKVSEVFPYLGDLDKNYEEVFNTGETLAFKGGAIEYTLIPVKGGKMEIEKIVTVLRRVTA